MLFIAGVVSIIEQSRLRNSMKLLIEENYTSIDAARGMIEALEREDSGVLLLVAGDWSSGRKIISSGDSLFTSAYKIAKGNLSIEGEDELMDSVIFQYKRYKSLWEGPIVGTLKEGNINWYNNQIHPNFIKVKTTVTSLMNMNQNTMYSSVKTLKNRTNRAIMPGIIAMISAFVFTIIFNFFINYYFVSPILKITRGIENHIKMNTPFQVEVETRDEIHDLRDAVSELISRNR